MRSRSVTSLSAIVMKRRSEATGWRRARTCRQSSSMSISSWLIWRSTAIVCSASALSRSMSARMLPLMISSTLAPMSRSFSRRLRSSCSYSRLVCSACAALHHPCHLTRTARDVVLGPRVARLGEEHVRAIELDELAQVEERRVVGDARRLLHVVGDDDDRVVLVELVDQLLDVRGGDRIERRGRLVHQQHLGLDGERARDAEALLLAAREASALSLRRSFTSSHSAAWRSARSTRAAMSRASLMPPMRRP